MQSFVVIYLIFFYFLDFDIDHSKNIDQDYTILNNSKLNRT